MNIFSNLSPYLKTVQERNVLLSELESLKQGLFSTEKNALEQIIQTQVRHDVSLVLTSLLREKEMAEEMLNKLEKYVHDLPVVQVTLAFDPTQEQLENIAETVQTDDQIPRLLDVEVNPGIIGGMQIAVNGKYGDYTLKKKMNSYWGDKGQEVVKKFFARENSL